VGTSTPGPRLAPPLVRRYLGAAFAFLLYGLSIGLHISAALHLGWAVFRGGYLSAHTHVLLVGFVTMLVAGLALWRLPQPAPRAWAWVPAASWWMLVATVLGRSTTEVLSGYFAWRWIGAAVFVVSCLQALTLAVLAGHLLRRALAHSAPR